MPFETKVSPLLSIRARWSKVPQTVRSYREACQLTLDARAALDAAAAKLALLDVPVRTIDAVEADIAALDRGTAGTEVLAALRMERAALSSYSQAATAVYVAAANLRTAEETEQEVLMAVTYGCTPSPAALKHIRALLNI